MRAHKDPGNWAACTIHDLIGSDGLFADGDWVESKDQDPAGSVRLIQLADVGDGVFRDKSSRYLTAEKAKELGCRFLKQGDVLISRLPDPLGKCCVFPLAETTDYATAVDVSIVRLHDEIDPRWFAYFFNSPPARSQVYEHQTGSTRARISRKNVGKVVLPCPPKNEQRRIVAKIEELFSELDNGVESLKAARAQLKTYRQSLLKAAFEGRLTEQWRRDNAEEIETADQLQQRVHEEREARYQTKLEAWEAAVAEWKKVGQGNAKPRKPARPFRDESDHVFCGDAVPRAEGWTNCLLGALIDSPQYGTSKKCRYESGEFPVLRIPNVANGYLTRDDMKYADFSLEELEKWRLKEGDLLIVRSNGSIGLLGSGAMVNFDHETYLYAGYLMRLRPNPKVLNPGFLRLAFQSPMLRSQIEQKGKSTSGVHNINAREVSAVSLPLCSIREQEEVVIRLENRLSQIDSLVTDLDREISRSDVLRQSILKRAFEGKLVPQDPDDQPASVLLERIRSEQQKKPKSANGRRKANA